MFFNFLFSFWIQKETIRPINFKILQEAKLPVIKTEFVPQISARGAIIMDADSKVVLYSKNPDLRFSTASTAKIMTALTALDYFKENDTLTIKEATNEGSVLGFKEGEMLSFESLLYAMLLPSANDAALAISQNYPGGKEEFIKKMNDKAKTLFLYNTHYLDPAGLEDIGDYTTPFDLARLASFAVKNDTLKKVVATKEKVIYDSLGNQYDLNNLNKLLGIEGVNGIKTGFTQEAGQVLVTSKIEKGKTIIIVVMGSDDRFLDTQKLLDLVSNNLTYLSIHP
ncbi:MAG TPA: D-alanyl-D-alanine carboxypeptidase [Candidatus Sulfotelmatobacter sp.]|nr:D-alanyl-D-alanine carboxypeptidase [Candidatus Sulfotelmatobacter sp.]